MAGSEGRATPFHCPYCADEDIRPYEGGDAGEGGHGAWECRACLRAFQVKLLGHLRRPSLTPAPGTGGEIER